MRDNLKTVEVVIPTYMPNADLLCLLSMLKKQTFPVRCIQIINTMETGWKRFLEKQKTTEDKLIEQFPMLEIRHIRPLEFDHGLTRDRGIQRAKSDYVVCMTQDAIPADEYLLENLLAPFMQYDKLAVSYARQLPKEDALELERYTREFNYPAKERRKTKKDIPLLGIKTYFCSDVCACYNRETYLSLGGFLSPMIFNEDMIFAAGAIQKGFDIYYAANALVYHSHNYSGMQQFKRNFDLGVSQAQHPAIFDAVASEREGIKMIKNTVSHLLKKKKPLQIIRLIYLSGCKWIGYRMGKKYKTLPKKLILKCTANVSYWEKVEK